MTYGQLKFRLVKTFPGIDPDLLESYISEAYQDILGALNWERLKASAILQTTAPYSTGSVAVTKGSASVTITGGAFTSLMSGRAFRVTGRTEYYEFTYSSGTLGSFDRVYEGDTNAAAGYSIFQHVYPLPANCRFLEDDAFSLFDCGPLERKVRGELDDAYPGRTISGKPSVWAAYMDDSSTPPRMQVELLPVPDAAYGIPFSYVAETDSPTETSTAILPWVQPSALIEFASAKIYRSPKFKDLAMVAACRAEGDRYLLQMMLTDAKRRGRTRMELDHNWTDYRVRRTCR